MRPIARSLLLLCLILAPAATSLADDAAVARLLAAVTSVREAPSRLPALLSALRDLDGLRLDAGDVASLRQRHGAGPAEVAPLLEALRSFSLESGVARLKLERPVMLSPLDDGKGALALAADASFVVREGADGAVALEDVRGVRVGQTPSLTLEVRRVAITVEEGRRIARAELRLGFIRRTVTKDLGPVNEGLADLVSR